jgi:hypothetical protein
MTVSDNGFRETLIGELNEIRDMLCEKNAAYGNSALDPVRVFSKADATEQLKVRIDDKISRLKRGHEIGEDTVLDLIGYLVLLRMAMRYIVSPGAAAEGGQAPTAPGASAAPAGARPAREATT